MGTRLAVRQTSRTEDLLVDIERWEEKYLRQLDWESRENANTNASFGAFIGYILNKVLRNDTVLSKYFPSEIVAMHSAGEIYMHKLPLSLYIPYCAGWSLPNLLKKGLATPTIYSNPARHFDTAISHLVNFFFLVANEWSGAQATSGLDIFLAPFVRNDDVKPREIRQALQRLVFELNYPSRIGFQSPFTNITIVMDLIDAYLDSEVYLCGKSVGIAKDYLDEALAIDKELLKLYLEGDALGRPFTFPIITLMLTPKFDWDGKRWGELSDLIFEVLAYRGSLYILNGYATDVEGIYAMCCRLTINTNKLMNHKFNFIKDEHEETLESLRKSKGPRGVWAAPDATGSIGVVTLNLPRYAILSRGDEDLFFDMIVDRMYIARKVLSIWRSRYTKSLENGLMPISREYLSSFSGHFSTIGIIGLPEAAVNLIGEYDIWTNSRALEAVMLMKKIVAEIRKITEEWENMDPILYNVEEVPGESAAYKLARIDYSRFRNEIEKGKAFIPVFDGEPIYSNSIIPYYAPISLPKRVEYEGIVQQEFTGGVMAHLFFGQSIDPRALKKLIRRIVETTKIVYFSITPAISICKKCKLRTVGVMWNCPRCGEEMEIWSRIVGYYRPLSSWHTGRIAEFKSRVHYGEE